MKTRFYLLTAAVAALTALYMLVPACGQNSGQSASVYPYNNPYGPYGTNGVTCPPGQPCATGYTGLTGASLTATPVMASIDSFGSTAQLQFGATTGAPGAMGYSGMVNVVGMIQMMPGGVCPPGTYQLQGQGQWLGQTGIPQVQATLQISGPGGVMQGQISGDIFTGQDPYAPNAISQYYFRGNFGTTCNPGGVAL